ncbi:unnamed protein product [Brugia pahangi]|uniref:G_PROTEIN_RECEP_F1_2 domain-containing protein n=1 Tax=Brugia pahangi TaxID=6280 RepID=A0A158PRD1_BRUPA|nr:unnamed protein product [Brugia pahangi]
MSVTWDQEGEQKLRVSSLTRETLSILIIVLLSLLCAVGLLGNLLVCIAIKLNRKLHNITNYFLFSLTLTDLLVCGVVMPLSLIVELHQGMWTWNFLMCLLYIYADVFLCTASIVHMSIISIDRYLGISKPLKARNKSKTLMKVKLASVWIATILISCPIVIMALTDSRNVFNGNTCRITNRYYMIYGSILAFLIPFLIMVVTYIRTTNLLKRQSSLISHQRTATNSHTEVPTILRHNFTQSNYIPKKVQNVIPFRRNIDMTKGPLKTTLLPIYCERRMEMLEKNRPRNLRQRTKIAVFAIGDKITKKEAIPKRSTELTNEHKATRVLAIVFACFFICWTPFFGGNLVLGFCGKRCALPPTIASFFLWLGYFSSTINPLIYTIFNRQFRRTILEILRCHCAYSVQNTYTSNYYWRQLHNNNWVTTDRPDLEQERSNPLRCKGCLDESKPSRQEQSVRSIQPDGLPLVTNRGIGLLQKNVQPAVSHQLQNKLKAKHLSWKS